MSLKKLSEVLEYLEIKIRQDEEGLTKAIKNHDSKLESVYQERCNIRDEIINMLKCVDEL